jgi:profilin
MTSWQNYIENNLIGSGSITDAAILQLDGVTLAASKDFVISSEDARFILDGMKDSSLFYKRGVVINGVRHIFRSGSANIVRAEKETRGVYIYKTDKLLIVCTYDMPIKPTHAASAVNLLASSLVELGY